MLAASRPLRVLHVAPSFHPADVYGGPTYSTHGLCLALAQRGVDVRVLTTNANGRENLHVESGEVALAPGFRVRRCSRVMVDAVSFTLLRWLPSLLSWADVVHLTAVYSFPTWPTLLACRRARKPVVWSPRGSLQTWASNSSRRMAKALWRQACRHLLPDSAALHATSQLEAEDVAPEVAGLPRVIIPNAVDPATGSPMPVRSDGFRLLFIGRLHPKKGLEALLEACARLRGRLDCRLTIGGAGEPSYTRSLESRIESLRLTDRVTLAGDVRGSVKERLFQESHAVVVPSHSENFCMVVAEALARGRPVIASRGTPWRALEERECGLWVDNTPSAIAAAIERISEMPLAEMGERGRVWMGKEFSWSTVAARMEAAYRSLLG